MRIYPHGWPKWVFSATARLKIGSHCVICASPGMPDVDYCDHCESLLMRCLHTHSQGNWSELCVSCGTELCTSGVSQVARSEADVYQNAHASEIRLKCSVCRELPSLFSCIIVPYRYQFPLEHIIKDLKYRHRRQLGRVLGVLLARSVEQFAGRLQPGSFPDFIIPVPMHPLREAARGFNQATDIARWCGRELKVEVCPWAASRTSDTGSLAGLSRAERQYRVLGAFQAASGVAGKRVAIVDDVLTTGSTARELARELHDTGVKSVELWVLARTSRER